VVSYALALNHRRNTRNCCLDGLPSAGNFKLSLGSPSWSFR